VSGLAPPQNGLYGKLGTLSLLRITRGRGAASDVSHHEPRRAVHRNPFRKLVPRGLHRGLPCRLLRAWPAQGPRCAASPRPAAACTRSPPGPDTSPWRSSRTIRARWSRRGSPRVRWPSSERPKPERNCQNPWARLSKLRKKPIISKAKKTSREASQASRWASRDVKARSRLCSVDLRV
jgi:hypothetical protein